MTCTCVWDCSHAWCGCSTHREVRCVCGVRPDSCPIHAEPIGRVCGDYPAPCNHDPAHALAADDE